MGLVLVEAYALGDRILASTFRRQANNTLIGLEISEIEIPTRLQPIVTYAFANIPNDRSILQFLTNKFCKYYDPEDDDDEQQDALSELPPAFIVRVIRRLAYLRRHGALKGCYVEHATDEEKMSCRKRHPNFSGGEKGYDYLGEPRNDVISYDLFDISDA